MDVPDPNEMPEEKAPPVAAMTDGYAPESVNLAVSLPPEDAQRFADRVHKDYERDWSSSERYREKRASILKLFIGMLPAPVDGEIANAQIHYPIIATAVQRIHSRIYDQQFQSNGEFFGAHPTDARDMTRSIRIAKHMNWQVARKIPEYVPEHDAGIMQWLLYGSAFSYMYWSPTKNRPCFEFVSTEDMVLPYARKSRDPSLANVPRITRVLRMARHELEEMQDSGYYANVDKLYVEEDKAQANGDQAEEVVQEVVDRAAGVEKPSEQDPDAPRVLLEQHRWLKLPGEERQRPVIVVIDKETKTLLCLKLREDEEPDDRARYNREKAANEASYQAAMAQYEMDMQAYMSGMPAPMSMTPMPMQGEMDSAGPMGMQPPPEMPQPPPEPAQPKMVPINFFTHYICIPNPEGIYGFGIGFMLEGHNMAADVVASQIVDAGTLANTITGVFSRQAKLSRGEFKIKPGEFVSTDLAPQDVEKGIHILKFPGPDPALASFIKDQKEEAQELSGANDILSGEVGGSNETATTTQIRISQALAAISIMNKRYTRARTVEGQKLARLNSVHLDDVEYFTVVDPFKQVPQPQPGMGMAPPVPGMSTAPGMPPMAAPPPSGPMMPQVTEEQVSRMDYLEDVDITITADPRMASQPQRVAEAMQIFNAINSSPFLAQNPALQIAAARRLFMAMDAPDMTAALEAMPMPMMGAPGPGGPPGGEAGPGGPPQPEPTGPSVPNAGPTPSNGDSPMGQVS